MALSMLRHETTQWEVVKSRKADRRKKETQDKGGLSAAREVPGAVDKEKNAFAAFDALHSEAAPRQSDGSNGRGSPQNGAHSSEHETPHQNEDTPKPMGKKKDKKKKQQQAQQQLKELPPKTAVNPSPGLTAQSLKSILKDVAVRYPDNEVAQLQYVADKFLPAFKDKTIPFPAEIYIKPVEETVDIIQGLLSPKMTTDLCKFLESKSVDALSEGSASFCGALFDLTSGPKAQLKDHLGLVVMIAAVARASPVAVVRCGRTLMAEGPRFTAPNKLPLLVWVIAQAERAAPGSMLALWLQVILPQLLGVDLEQAKNKKGKGKKEAQMYVLDPKNYTIVADCLKRGVSGDSKSGFSPKIREAAKEGLKMKCKGTEVTEPVVSLSSLNKIQCAICLDLTVPIPSQILSQLNDLYPTLRSLAFSSASHSALHDFLKSSLDFAAKSEGGYLGKGDRIVDEATENIIGCLLKDSDCFDVWTTKHKGQIRGSCRVLQHLLHSPPRSFQKLMSLPTNKTQFLRMVKKLQDRHGILLAQAKGWQGACARGAHEACKRFLENSGSVAKKRGKSVSPMTLFVAFALFGLTAAVISAKWNDLCVAVDAFLETEQGKVVRENLEGLKVYVQKAADSEAGQWVFSKLEKAASFASELARQKTKHP